MSILHSFLNGLRTKSRSGSATTFNPRAGAEALEARIAPAAVLTSTMVDTWNDADGDGEVEPGEVISYEVIITNTGDLTTTNGVRFEDLLESNLVLVSGSLNVSPLALDDAYTAVRNTQLQVGPVTGAPTGPQLSVVGSVFNNDREFLTDGYTLSAIGSTAFGGTETAHTLASGSKVTMDAEGNFTYLPAAGLSGTSETFTYTIRDDGTDSIAGNGDDLSSVGTVTINFSTDEVWYVDNAYAGANGASDGTSARPFTSLGAVTGSTGPDGVNDIIYVASGSGAYTGTMALLNGQKFLGQAVPLVIPGIGLLQAAGGRPSINNASGDAVTVNSSTGPMQGIVIQGLSLQGSVNAIDITSGNSNAVGVTIDNNVFAGSGQDGVDLNSATNAAFAVTFTNNTVNASAGNALDARSSFGSGAMTLNVSNNTITSSSGGILIDGGGGGSVMITGFANNTITGNTVGGGATINAAVFDSDSVTPGFQVVNGGTLAIGSLGNSVGTTGLNLINVRGHLSFSDLDIYTNNGTALRATSGAPFNGTTSGFQLQVASGVSTIDATGGQALDFNTVLFDLQQAVVRSVNSPSHGIQLINVDGSTLSTASGSGISGLVGATSVAFRVADSTGNITFNGPITTSVGTGVELANNTGATISLGGTLTISSGTNVAFTATGGGTVNVTGSGNTLTTTTATALNVVNTTIGASNITFQSISSTGASGNSGIVMNNTGTAVGNGGLIVTGTLATGSGGTISNKTVDGISLTNTRGVSLSRMVIDNNGGNGISGTDVTNFSLSNSTVSNNDGSGIAGTNVTNFSLINSSVSNNADTATGAEAGLRFTNLWGTSAITGSTFSAQSEDHVRITNNSGTLTNLTVSGSTFNANSAVTGGHGISMINTGTAVATITVNTTNFTGIRSSAILVNGTDTTNNTLNVTGGTFTDIGSAVTVQSDQSADLNFNVSGITSIRAISNAIQLVAGSTSTPSSNIVGIISSNIIGNATADSGSRDMYGIAIDLRGDQDSILSINNNNIQHTDISGIFVNSADFGSLGGPSARMDLHLVDNTVGIMDDNSAFPFFTVYGVLVDVRHTTTAYLDISGNSSTGLGGLEHFRFRQRDTSQVFVERLTDGDGTPGELINTVATVESFFAGQNDAGSTADVTLVSGFREAADGAARVPLLFFPTAEPDVVTPPPVVEEPSGETVTPPEITEEPEITPPPIAPGDPGIADDGVLSQTELDTLVDAAIARWAATGLSAEQIELLQSVTFVVSDLSGWSLGMASGTTVTLDTNAAGNEWFVDATPNDDIEFVGTGSRMTATFNSGANGRVDALTTIMHELGHVLGLEDSYNSSDRDSLMYGWIGAGERRIAQAGEAEGADPSEHASEPVAFIGGPINIGDLPAGKGVTIRFQATVNPAIMVGQVSNQGFVRDDGGALLATTDDPSVAGAANPTVTLVDLPDVTVGVSAASVAEDGSGMLTYTFTREGSTGHAITVNFGLGGTASASDFSISGTGVTFDGATGTIVILAGASSATITLSPTDDSTVEADETAIVNVLPGPVSAPGYEVGTANSATGTIVNDDTEVAVSLTPASVTEDGAGNLVYTFTRTGVTSNAIAVNFSLTGTANFVNGDYSVGFPGGGGSYSPGTESGFLTFGAGVTSIQFVVNPSADTVVEGDETVIATVTSGTGYNVAGTPATGIITNDDTDVTLSVAPASVTEDGAGNLVYTFTRTGFTANSLVVNFTVGGTAAQGDDYFANGATTYLATIGTVTFAAGSAAAIITINPVDDTTVEGDETTILTLASGTGYNVVTTGAVTGTILNDDTDLSVAVAPASVTEDGASNLVYTFTRTGVTATALTVNFNVTGTASLTGDYSVSGANSFNTGSGAGTVTFAAGSNTATVTIDPAADLTVEGNETAVLTLTSGTGYNVVTTGAVTGTILNDDTDLSIAVAPASVTEDGAGNLVYTFTRTGVTTGAVTVNFSIGGTATFNTDYTQTGATTFNGTTGTIDFAAGETTKTITIDPTVDSTVELDETAILTITSGTGYNPVGTAATGTITNDDASISLAMAPASVAEDGADNLIYTFTRSGFTTNALTVNFSVGGTATFTSDYSQSGATTFNTTTGTVTFAAGSSTATITIDPTPDVTGEPDETVNLTITAGGGYGIGTAGAVTGTILNDDTAVSVAVSPGTSSESTLTPFVYTFTRTGDTSTPLTVNFNVGGTAIFTNDYTAAGAASFNATTGSVVIPVGESSATITLTPVNDTTAEASETAVLTVASGSGYSPSGVGAAGTILDNDIDLQITKTDGVTTEIPGTTATYTIIVTNAGLSAVAGASIADSFVAILTNVSYTAVTAGGATGFTASGNGNIHDTAVNMPAGATITYTVTGTILASATGTLVNTASVTVPTGITDPNLANNSASDTDTLVPQGDLTVTKTDGKTTLVPGTTNTYTIVASNNGPSDVVGATFADTFPAGFTGVTFIAVGAGGASGFSASGAGNLNETLNLPAGATVTYTVTGNVAANIGGTFSNTAAITAPASFTDTNAGNNSATDSDILTPQGDLSVTKTDGKTTLVPGTLNTYTIVVTNSGPSNVVGATFTDTFPAGLTGVTYTAVGAGGASGFTANGSGNLNQSLNLPSGASVTYTVTGTVSSAATGSFSNTATIFAPAGFTDTSSENNSATDTDTLTPQVDLSITKTDGKTTAVPGTTNTYTIVVSNSGPSDAVGATLADLFPVNFTNVTYTAVGTGGASGFPANGSGSFDQLVNLPSGATITYTVTGTILASATGSLVNTATISPAAGTTDTLVGNNSATDSDTLTAQADLSITKTDGVTTLVPGTQTTYTIVVTNNGPSDTSATVADTFPASLSNVTFTAVGAGGAVGFADGSGNLNQAVTIPSGGSITYTVTGTVNAGATGTLSNTATVTAGGGATDTNAGNNSATDTDTLTPQGDLSITKTDGVVNVIPGANNTYTIVVTNNGPSNVVGATVGDTFPAGFSNVTFTATGSAGTSFSASGNGNLNDTVNIPAGGSITYTVTGKVASSLTGTFTNTASIFAPDGFTDANPGNNSATDTDTLTPQTDLQVMKTDSPDPVVAGTNLTYTITLSNLGVSDAANITLTDLLPAGTTFVSLSTPGGYSTTTPAVGADGAVTITGASVAAGSSSVFTLVVSTASSLSDGLVLSNTASVSTTTLDTNEGNNSSTATTTVATQADLAITKTDSPDPVFVGNNLTYTITLNNLGASDAQGVSISDVIPAGLTFISATAPHGWNVSAPGVGANGTVAFTKTSAVVAGENDTFTIVVAATSAAGGTTVSNTATVTSTTTDPIAANNSATADTTVGGVNLTVTKSDGVISTIPGAALTYVINYGNAGFTTATGVVLTETLPAGTTFNAAENPGWTAIGANQYTYAVPSLAAGATGSVNFVVHVQSEVSAGLEEISSTLTITDDGTQGLDIDVTNNAATDTDILQAAPELQISIVDLPSTAIRGGTTAYTVSYSNVGNQNAVGAVITMTLPENTSFDPFASTGIWELVSPGVYSTMVGDLTAGAVAGEIIFAVRLDSNVGSDYRVLTTTGTIADDGENGLDPTPTNNTDTEATPVYQGIYAVSPGVALPRRGGEPMVRVFDVATNAQIFEINAYESNYRDSIRIAMGDINGDGYDDIITAKRTGSGSVRVFDGRTGDRFEGAFSEIAAFTEKGAKGAFVASGDVTGDGRDDIIVGSGQGAKGSGKVRVFDGRTGDLVSTAEPFGSKFRGGVRVAVGDVNGDGMADIIVGQGVGGNDVKVTSGTSSAVLHNLEIGGSRYRGGVFVATADLDGDGKADLIAGRDRGKTVIETYNGATGVLADTIVPFAAKYRLGVRVSAADINFDGVADIIAGVGGRGRSEVKIFDGTNGTVLHTFTAFPRNLTGSLFVAGTSPVPSVAQFNEQPA